MKRLIALSLGVAMATTAHAATINIDTGVASWQVFVPSSGFVSAVSVTPNGTWAPAPTGSSWVSWGANESVSCVVGQTPGNGCAHTLSNPNGDIWTYTLSLTAAQLGATAGSLSFVFGSDNRVNLFAGNTATAEVWNGGSNTNGTGYNPLGCSATVPTSAGSTNPYACNSSILFDASDLNGDGSLTLTAYSFNDPIPGCPACGDPTGFVLSGTLTTGGTTGTTTPEPATFGLIVLAGVAGLALRRKRV